MMEEEDKLIANRIGYLIKRGKIRTKTKSNKYWKYQVIDDYLLGDSVHSITKKYGIKDDEVNKIIQAQLRALLNKREETIIKYMYNNSLQVYANKLKEWQVMTESFTSLLSPPTSPDLSESEMMFAFVYANEYDDKLALSLSGLDVGLEDDKESDCVCTVTREKAIRFRILYLLKKKNIKDYIDKLREENYKEAGIDKSKVMSELYDLLESLKKTRSEKRDNNKELLKVIELLGKGLGVWVEKIEVGKIDPSEALDRLIEMAKEEQGNIWEKN